MKLPPIPTSLPAWPRMHLERWKALARNIAVAADKAGQGDHFEDELRRLRAAMRKGSIPAALFKRRVGARALSWLWLNETPLDWRDYSSKWLQALFDGQQPHLTSMTLLQLLALYFKHFDRFDAHGTFRTVLEANLRRELRKPRHSRASGTTGDPIRSLSRHLQLLQLEGPAKLVRQCISEERELAAVLNELGLQQMIDGRYGDVCRSQYYLEKLRSIPEGAPDAVLDELRKPEVHAAPYQYGKTIGLATLEILIDRASKAHEAWQTFILKLAGDPRLTTHEGHRYWAQLGETRIAKVCGWLARMDLRLFLDAVSTYARTSGNADQMRMYPARERFMQGLLDLDLVRGTRLFLGDAIYRGIARALKDNDLLSAVTKLNNRRDTAVIYLDCGSFHLIEGSHSFKLWVYLAQPAAWLSNYNKSQVEDWELTTVLQTSYHQAHPRLPSRSIVHQEHAWQNTLFTFLGEQGIALDIEKLLSPADYHYQQRRYGIPSVISRRS